MLASRQLDVIIVSWNTAGLLRACLNSLYCDLRSSGLSFQVLVVDNASTDGSPKIVRDEFPDAVLIQNNQNLGFAKANNQALSRCASPKVLFLNPDTLVQNGMISALVGHLDQNPSVAAVGPRVLNPDHSWQRSASPFPSLGREAWRLFHLDKFAPYSQYPDIFFQMKLPQPADVLLGACILVRRSVIDQVGLLDEQFFVYSEEVDLCMRIRQAGWQVHWVPQAELVHYGGASTQQVSDEMFLELYRNKIRLFRKYYGVRYSRFYKVVLFFAAAVRILGFKIISVQHSDRAEKRDRLANRYMMLIKSLPKL